MQKRTSDFEYTHDITILSRKNVIVLHTLLWSIFIVLLLYTILPTITVRLLYLWVYKKKVTKDGIALTFDDGPDPEFTPQLLDLLSKYQVKATFFVLGSKAEKYPDIIQRIHQEGHLVGIHNYVHWTNACMTPKKVRKQLTDSVEAIEKIIGIKPIYYRPPWGIINVFDLFLVKRFRLVLWSLMVKDWRSKGGIERIKSNLLAKLQANHIIVLHDSGQTFGANRDAPQYMLEALDAFLEICKQRSFTFLPLDTYLLLLQVKKRAPSRLAKKFLVFIWLKWERVFNRLFNIRPIDVDNQIFYSRVCKYHGKTIHLGSGEELSSGDLVIELHFNNEKLHQLITESNSMFQLAVKMKQDVQSFLPTLAQHVHLLPEKVKAIYGITMIHRGSRQLGFTVTELPKGLFSKLTQLYLKMLLYVLHPNGKDRLKLKSELLSPRIATISTEELYNKYAVSVEPIPIPEHAISIS
ncbi:polysaccharide deacetylase family protein [Paenibacillus sp. 5J-6]|uniref:Polysaccharide deacetylase family protein n=1 Tax=Paenibacillus silvestris TaxID=2606219 RepID=A0A6L8V4N8_9BACL|nr:polysaccharide deacetylase family protein [Paenibacillus silvestris]MZQ85373.1 polysaccharide deacetylase family protein [Paenibacillus silvestris]